MDSLQIIFLSIIQGLTEFLPISSSAHLILGSALFDWQDQGTWFDLSVHAGSLVAVVIYLRVRLLALLQGWLLSFRGKGNSDGYLAWLLCIATLPACLAGLVFENFFVGYARSILVIAWANSFFAVLLYIADYIGKKQLDMDNMKLYPAISIGIAQAIALIPGASRSGITISVALLLGFNRKTAAEFSFLLAIPIIIAASLFQSIRFIANEDAVPWFDFGLGFVCSAIAAYLCIVLFIRVISTISFLPFVIYRLLLACILFVVYLI